MYILKLSTQYYFSKPTSQSLKLESQIITLHWKSYHTGGIIHFHWTFYHWKTYQRYHTCAWLLSDSHFFLFVSSSSFFTHSSIWKREYLIPLFPSLGRSARHLVHTSYLSHISHIRFVEKNLSCGEISDLHAQEIWRNLKFLHMWSNFKFLHMTDVKKFEVSPHLACVWWGECL